GVVPFLHADAKGVKATFGVAATTDHIAGDEPGELGDFGQTGADAAHGDGGEIDDGEDLRDVAAAVVAMPTGWQSVIWFVAAPGDIDGVAVDVAGVQPGEGAGGRDSEANLAGGREHPAHFSQPRLLVDDAGEDVVELDPGNGRRVEGKMWCLLICGNGGDRCAGGVQKADGGAAEARVHRVQGGAEDDGCGQGRITRVGHQVPRYRAGSCGKMGEWNDMLT